MNIITETFGHVYEPRKALVIYGTRSRTNAYVESFDFSDEGQMINAHPLSNAEMQSLAKCLMKNPALSASFTKPKGIMPGNILYLSAGKNPFVVWHTPKRKQTLLFIKEIGIAEAVYSVPPMIWKADKETLWVYALKKKGRPALDTQLSYTPFFNIYNDGRVCMGTVNIDIKQTDYLEDFTSKWESYFFNSRFSHSLGNNPVGYPTLKKAWKILENSGADFPVKMLPDHKYTLKTLIGNEI